MEPNDAKLNTEHDEEQSLRASNPALLAQIQANIAATTAAMIRLALGNRTRDLTEVSDRLKKITQDIEEGGEAPGVGSEFKRYLDKSPAFNEETTNAVQTYRTVGTELINNPIVQAIRTTIIGIYAFQRQHRSEESTALFYLVDLHSGTGKTQLCYSLETPELPTVHLLLNSDASDGVQPIYRPLLGPSNLLSKALEIDITAFRKLTLETNSPDPMLSANLLIQKHGDEQLELVGFLSAICFRDMLIVHTINELRDRVLNPDLPPPPVVLVDEVLSGLTEGSVSTIRAYQERKLVYLRSLLSAVGVVGVYMGTNSSAVNFIKAVQQSRSGARFLWGKLITRLPLVTDGTFVAKHMDELMVRLMAQQPAPQPPAAGPPPAEQLPPAIMPPPPPPPDIIILPAPGVIMPAPPADVPLDPLHRGSLVNFLDRAFRSTTPWFAGLVAAEISAIGDAELLNLTNVAILDRALFAAATKVFASKRSLNSREGTRAQVYLFAEGYRLDVVQPSRPGSALSFFNALHGRLSTSFIAHHFARIHQESCDIFAEAPSSNDDDEYTLHATADLNDNTTINFTARFPDSAVDPLHYMLLCGAGAGADFLRPFRSKKNPITSALAFLRAVTHHTKVSFLLANPSAEKSPGDYLEVMANIAAVVASHSNGLGGVGVNQFILTLVGELSLSLENLRWQAGHEPAQFVTRLEDPAAVIPYLAPPGGTWPDHLRNVHGARVAGYFRPPDLDRVDGYSTNYNIVVNNDLYTHVYANECKNYSKPVSLGTLRNILSNVRAETLVHTVIITKLQATYFNKPFAWTNFRNSNVVMETTAIVRVTVGQDATVKCEPFQNVPNPLPNQCRRIVVFFSVEDNYYNATASV